MLGPTLIDNVTRVANMINDYSPQVVEFILNFDLLLTKVLENLDELKAELQEPAYRAYIEGRRGARLKEPSPREPVDARRKPE